MGLVAREVPAMKSVWPSGVARATYSSAAVVDEVARFSTTTTWPRPSLIPGASVRTMMSSVPPAAAGTTTRTGRVGNASALAASACAATPSSIAARTNWRLTADGWRLCFIRRAAHLRQVFLLDSFGVELHRPFAQGLQHFFQRRQLALDPGQRVDARHHEGTQIRAREAARLQLVHRSSDQLVELEDVLGVLLVLLEDLPDRLRRECFQLAQDGRIGAAGEGAFFLVAQPERHQRRFLEIEGEVRLGARAVLFQQVLVDADHFESALAQVVRLLGIEREDLPGDLALGDDERHDRLRAQAAHRRQPVPPVRRPEAFLGRGDRDQRIEEQARLVEHAGELLVMRFRQVALEGRGLDLADRQRGEEDGIAAERLAVGAEHDPAFLLDAAADLGDFAGSRIEPAFLRQDPARSLLCLLRRALRGGALAPAGGFRLGGGCHCYCCSSICGCDVTVSAPTTARRLKDLRESPNRRRWILSWSGKTRRSQWNTGPDAMCILFPSRNPWSPTPSTTARHAPW